MECKAAWGASQANIVKTCLEKMWTTTWSPSVGINRVCGHQLIEITWQACGRESPQGRGGCSANDGKESQKRRATTACIILFCTAVGRDTIFFVTSFTKYRRAPVIPVLLRNSQTARDRVNPTPRSVGRTPARGLGRTHAAAWCGETDALDEASRGDMGGLLGQRCLILSSETRTCVR